MRDLENDVSKVDGAYFRLKDLVTQYDLVTDDNARLLPGEHLHIDELSDRLKTSATPVRQALERLQGEGLIDCIPKRGFFAKTVDASELQDLFEFALLVLCHSIRGATDLSAVSILGPRPIEVEVPADAYAADKCFKHQATMIESVFERIARLSRNGQMNRIVRNFNDRSRYVRCLALVQSPDPHALVRDSLTVVHHIRSKDGEAACACLEIQIRQNIKDLPRLVRDARSRWRDAVAVGR